MRDRLYRDKPHFSSVLLLVSSFKQTEYFKSAIMPLVVPGINSSFGDKSEWVNKLMGKTIGDTSNETVRHL